MKPLSTPVHSRHRGFTLVEMVAAIAILSILTAIAYPTFASSLRKARRSDAVLAVTTVMQAQERWRSNNTTFAASISSGDGNLGLSSTSPGGFYTLALSSSTSTGYVLTASAVSGTSQANDAGCTVMQVRVSSGSVQYASGASRQNWSSPTDAARCWAR